MDPFDGILAQETALKTLRHALLEERIPTAYLFEGPSGVGKEKTAWALAEHLVAPLGAGNETEVASRRHRIRAGSHPDVRVFRPRDEGHGNLAVDTVRNEILPFVQYAPFEGPRAVLIFPEADRALPEQHPEGANALLKTLEEPRQGVHFILLSERPERLLQTLRSRCQALRFRPLPDSVLAHILEGAEIPEAGRQAALSLALGRADRALSLARAGMAEALLKHALELDTAAATGRPGALVDAAETLAKHGDRTLILEAWMVLYQTMVHTALGTTARGASEAAKSFQQVGGDTLVSRAQRLGPAAASTRALRIQACLDSLEWNANPNTALDALLFDLAA